MKGVFNQSFTDFEFIIVDDGSDDNTRQIVAGFPHKRIKYIYRKHSGHISELRNIGLKESSGEFIAFLDSDDVWEKNYLAFQAQVLENKMKSGFVFSDVVLVNQQAQLKRIRFLPEYYGYRPRNFFPYTISGKLPIYPSCLMFSRECLKTTGMLNENMNAGEMDFITKLANHFKG